MQGMNVERLCHMFKIKNIIGRTYNNRLNRRFMGQYYVNLHWIILLIAVN